ncbi:MAG: general stress protein [Ktedonobacteraceae bacterium]|nr:general stress protein [Ktedonobacteraceae bacterium]
MTTNSRTTVVGVFTTRANAQNAITDLHSRGFTDQQIGFIARDNSTAVDQASTTDETEVPTGERAAVGAASGGVVGGLLGAAASLLIPGFGPAIAGGILAATLGGIAIGAATGGIIGTLTHVGVPEEEASYYQKEFEAGRTLVTVDAPGRQQEAIDTMRRNGAYDASTRPGTYDATDSATTTVIPDDTFQTGNAPNPGVTSSTSSAVTLEPPAETHQPGAAYDPIRGGTFPTTTGPDTYNAETKA